MYYVIPPVMFCMSILFALTPYYAPLEVAALMTVNMLAEGLYMRGLGREAEPAGEPLAAHSQTSIQTGEREA